MGHPVGKTQLRRLGAAAKRDAIFRNLVINPDAGWTQSSPADYYSSDAVSAFYNGRGSMFRNIVEY